MTEELEFNFEELQKKLPKKWLGEVTPDKLKVIRKGMLVKTSIINNMKYNYFVLPLLIGEIKKIEEVLKAIIDNHNQEENKDEIIYDSDLLKFFIKKSLELNYLDEDIDLLINNIDTGEINGLRNTIMEISNTEKK